MITRDAAAISCRVRSMTTSQPAPQPDPFADWESILNDRADHVSRALAGLKLARDAQKAAALAALESGHTEVSVARWANVDRMTVRAWRGK